MSAGMSRPRCRASADRTLDRILRVGHPLDVAGDLERRDTHQIDGPDLVAEDDRVEGLSGVPARDDDLGGIPGRSR